MYVRFQITSSLGQGRTSSLYIEVDLRNPLTNHLHGAGSFLPASQEIPRILWNPEFHYSIHKRPPPALEKPKL